ncbi:MAG TPA: type III-A CRISPR-associated RAMP protein Csm5 [Bryobacteraceae bacterium]|nr:type III-A CRISPR-associated RAMP protein Csm5 [Bryobacteraceae bacterium]
MKFYKLTVLTPTLVGDGQRLSPIDYMVWRDQVNVLDQTRIFKLLARGPRLEGYLTQLGRAEKLDFASWGGFAQSYAERRIPFEHPSLTPAWEQTRPENLFIPTFCSSVNGPYMPASAMKGALRTGFAFTRWNAGAMREIAARMEADRPLRRPGEAVESMTIGSPATDPMRMVMAGDSDVVPVSSFKVYLVRVATLQDRGGRAELGWKPVSTFAEMAAPGTVFKGHWRVREFLREALHRRDQKGPNRILEASNEHAAALLDAQRKYAESAGMPRLRSNIDALVGRLEEVRQRGSACLLNLGWAGGFLGKAAFLDTGSEDYRRILRRMPLYDRAIRSGMPFPKTRKIVWEAGQPSTLPGWALLEVV